MKRIVHALIITFLTISTAKAQLISKFTWESGVATQADFGPNAISISSTASVSTGGAGSSKGLNAGTGSHDIMMVLPGSYFTIASLDISVDFKRKESDASFFQLGGFDFGMTGGNLYAKYVLAKGSSDTTIKATNLNAIPSDNNFHTYRFKYLSTTGTATVTVDGANVYTYTRGAGIALSWTGAGNATIGNLMDGTNSNIAILDNLIIQNPSFAPLPLTLLSFEARTTGNHNDLSWTTTKEVGTKNFVIERSTDGADFEAIGTVGATSVYSATNNYSFADSLPAAGDNYYRLKMVDLDGAFTYSSIRKLSNVAIAASAATSFSVYPNPVVNTINVKTAVDASYRYTVYTLDGKVLQTGVATGQTSVNVSSAPHGMIVMQVQHIQDNSRSTFKVFKQ